MYPNQPQQFPAAPPPSPDYLNQIAPQAPKPSLFKFGLKSILMLGGALVVLVIILVVTVGAISSSQKQPLEQIAARLASIEKIATESQENLKSSKLRSTNSNLQTYLTNTNRDIGKPMLSAGIDVAKLPESILTKESSDGILARLEDARLNAVFDRTYAREMTYVLSNTLALMKQASTNSGNAAVRQFIETALPSLIAIQASFAEFNGTN